MTSVPRTPPTVGIFDAPGASLCLNTEWASYIDGALRRFLFEDYWEGTDAEIDGAIFEIEKLLIKLADVGACALTPIGAIMMHGAAAAPDGWLICDGAAVSRVTYAELFAEIGTTWGPGNGTTTFNLPNMKDRSPMGSSGAVVPAIGNTNGALTVALSSSQMPAHSHGVNDPGHGHTASEPGHNHQQHIGNNALMKAFVAGGAGTSTPAGAATSSAADMNTGITAIAITVAPNTTGISTTNTGLGQAHGNLHPVVGVPFIIFAGV